MASADGILRVATNVETTTTATTPNTEGTAVITSTTIPTIIPTPQPTNSTNLIINYLPQSLSDEDFRKMFQVIGPLKTSKICRHKGTGYSYGYGFVEYCTPEHADMAITTLNGHPVQHKKIKVALARPCNDKIKGANLYVRNLPRTLTTEQVKEFFGRYGTVINCKLLTDGAGMSKGVGFVLFDQKPQAQAAISALNTTQLEGAVEPLIVRFADENVRPPPRARMAVAPSCGLQTPFVRPAITGNLGQNRFNPLGTSYGFRKSGQKVGQPGPTLFLYNIGTNATERTIGELFSPYGDVQKVNVMWDWHKNQCKGHGFVTYATVEQAQAAIVALDGFYLTARPMEVSFKKWLLLQLLYCSCTVYISECEGRTGRISAWGVGSTGSTCKKDRGPMFSQYGPSKLGQ